MSRKGNCLDNACIESFIGHLKAELFDFKELSSSHKVKEAIDKYIHFSNHERIQTKLNSLSPIEFRLRLHKQAFLNTVYLTGVRSSRHV
ncbi:IS3 family transposase [Aneurinibacillus sp. Ricciae_BoGa-3]|uniref:IS3 family transposase n=1 Tax=Aneurinibacillus sp. Ricciae_BoGa-3 TaxID=3022697 RepID=UPI003FA41B22